MKLNPSDLKVYFASPWFNPDQAEREERIKLKLRNLGFNVWSPKESCVCPPDATNEMRVKTFNDNCENIRDCHILFAITDGKDMGTIWEAGYACGVNNLFLFTSGGADRIIIVYYCETLGDGKFNLMLANSGDIVITSFEDLNNLPKYLETVLNGGSVNYAGQIE